MPQSKGARHSWHDSVAGEGSEKSRRPSSPSEKGIIYPGPRASRLASSHSQLDFEGGTPPLQRVAKTASPAANGAGRVPVARVPGRREKCLLSRRPRMALGGCNPDRRP